MGEDDLAGLIWRAFSANPNLHEGLQWFQGDPMLFMMNGVPALALTSDRAKELTASVIHTPEDRPELIDPRRLVDLARTLDVQLNHFATFEEN